MSAQNTLIHKYGEPDHSYLIRFCHVWTVQNDFPWFPVHSFLVNNDFQVMLKSAFASLQDKGLHTEIKTYDGCYNDRNVRGASILSLHCWAAAIDLNASLNPMIVSPKPEQRLGKWSKPFVDTIKEKGIFFGGDFIHRADSMHFALLDG